MNREIIKIVNSLDIPYKRNQVLKNNKKIFHNEREMSKLTFNPKIGRYAFNLDEYFYYLDKLSKDKTNEKYLNKLDYLFYELIRVENDKDILKYRKLRDEIKVLKEQSNEYYKTINIDLRNKLNKLDHPEIFIYQGNLSDEIKYSKDLFDPKRTCGYSKDFNYVIYPNYEIESNNDLKSFYNKTSFKYLEELTKDYIFDINNKKLTKIRTK